MIPNGISRQGHRGAVSGFSLVVQDGSDSVLSSECESEVESELATSEKAIEAETEDEDAARKRQLLTCLLSPESNNYLSNRKERLERLRRDGHYPRVQEANPTSSVSRWPTTSPITARSSLSSTEAAASSSNRRGDLLHDSAASSPRNRLRETTPVRKKSTTFAIDKYFNVSPEGIGKSRSDITTINKLPGEPSTLSARASAMDRS